MKIKMIVSCATPDACYSKNREYDVTDEIGNDLVRAQYAAEVRQTETAKVKPPENAKTK